MYRVHQYEVLDPAALREVMEEFPFATVTSICDGKAWVNHLPIVTESADDGRIRLLGHMSRRNAQWKHMRDGSELVIAFHGPHTYINPSWYAVDDVPTWNYVAVHATGKAGLIEDYAGLIRILKKTTDHMNRRYTDQWDFFLPEDLSSEYDLTSAIVGFQMIPEKLEGKFKLSQTRSQEDRDGVVVGLRQRTDEGSRMVREWMEKK